MQRVLNDRYELRQHAARGGMADVYHGWDRRLDREVGVKVLRPELSADDDYVDRFREEARTAARLTNPNIVSVYDTGSHQGDAYMVMEWVDGPTLSQVIRAEAPLPVQRACRIGADIAAGLSYAHEHGVTNRDVKSSNVLLTPTGHAKVTDFGIALVPERSTVETLPGIVLGTPAYLSPEQLTGQPADARSDIYGLGAVLFEMVTGRRPFVGDTPAEIAGNALHSRPPQPSSINPAVPPSFEAILSKALARDPNERYQTAAELRADLVECARGGTPAVTPADATVAMAAEADATRAMSAAAPVAVAAPPRRRRTAEAWLIGVVLALAVLAVIIALLASSRGGGGANTIAVPSVVGFTQTAAERAIRAKGLNPVSVQMNDPTMLRGNVISTDPPPGNKVAKNATVTLNISAGPTSTTRRTTPVTRPVTVPTTETPTTTESPTTPTSSSGPTITFPTPVT